MDIEGPGKGQTVYHSDQANLTVNGKTGTVTMDNPA